MLTAAVEPWRHACYEELPLNQISGFPLLDDCYRLWCERQSGGGLPARLDPVELPRQILPTVLLYDLDAPARRLRIRLAGTGICDKHGSELRGKTPEQVFDPEDARLIGEVALSVAMSRRPSLARRSCVAIGERLWTFTRLVLPLSRGGSGVDSFFEALDPLSMRRAG